MGSKKSTFQTIIQTAIIIFVATLGSIFVAVGMKWFNSLSKPTQWIPNVIIPIVWTIIYITFAIINSLWIKNTSIPKKIIILMLVNGFLNILWCLVFFTLKLTFIGNIVIILNLIAGIILWKEIYNTNKLYSYILSIYPIWLSIATTLNLALWILN
jgi:tryptophan-rich sensory protein